MPAQSQCERFTSDMQVSIRDRQRYCYPDITLGCGGLEFEDNVEDVLLTPVVVFEVLSPKTMGYDLGDKNFYYRQLSSLRNIVLVWHNRIRIAHWYRVQEDELWKYAEYEDVDASIFLAEGQVNLKLSDIYDRVTLPTR